MVSPFSSYKARLSQQGFVDDATQRQALMLLDSLFQQLTSASQSASPKGVYMWGDVGRGKTFLMDLFFDCLPEGLGLRLHFHHFMSRLHRELNLASGQANPLKGIAKRLANECKVLCFDEFFVSDVGDAMLLSGLVDALFEEGVVLVATSNIAIDHLFDTLLDSARFEPVVKRLNSQLQSVNLNGKEDHRLRHKGIDPVYFVQDTSALELAFFTLSKGPITVEPLTVCHRQIPVMKVSQNLAWFDFFDLCDGPRSSLDYIELATLFPIMMVSGIPPLSSEPYEHIKARGTEDSALGSGVTGERVVSYGINDDAVRRFISLVDECYDHHVVLYLSAALPLDRLYQNGSLLFEFRRTYSRLIEMQSLYYQSLRSSSH